MKILRSIYLLSRPVNVVIGMLSIILAAFITGTFHPLHKVLLAAISGGIITAGANSINDYFDLEIDRINKPNRPLPAGTIQPSLVKFFAIAEFFIGIALAGFINLTAFLIAASISLLLFLYSFRLKRMPLVGNLAVSFSTAMAFVYGGVSVNRIERTLIPAAFAFFYHFGREIIKDIQDMEGDDRYRARTFPLVFGKSAALRLTTLNFMFLIVLTVIPFAADYYGYRYFWVVLLGIYPVLVYAIVSMWKNQSAKNLGLVSNWLKADMLIGLLAIYLG
ncbi:MAG: geranylgeranylglycerol-phosphate geranylgeranyltransferase [Calditrichia bacterium]